MASVNQTRSHCVNQMGKTHSKPLAARHGRGTAWARDGNGMLCVNRPLLYCSNDRSSAVGCTSVVTSLVLASARHQQSHVLLKRATVTSLRYDSFRRTSTTRYYHCLTTILFSWYFESGLIGELHVGVWFSRHWAFVSQVRCALRFQLMLFLDRSSRLYS